MGPTHVYQARRKVILCLVLAYSCSGIHTVHQRHLEAHLETRTGQLRH